MNHPEPVWITACGLITALGAGVAENWRRLCAGHSGQGEAQRFNAARFKHRAVCPVGPLPEPGLPMPDSLDAATRLLLAAAAEALAGTGADFLDAPIFVASTLGGMDNGCRFYRQFLAGGLDRADARLLKDYIPFMQCCRLRERFGFRRTPLLVTNACSSGANAVGLALAAIRDGAGNRAVAAGYDIISEFVFGGFQALRLVAPDACRPFDPERQGLVLGEGAGVMLLETAGAARAAGRRPLAELRAYAAHTEAYHVTKPQPSGAGAEHVMRACLAAGGVDPAAVDSVNAHGTGTVNNDLMEASAITRVFAAGAGPAVTANKGAIGHTLGAAGIIEAIFSALSIRDQVVPPTINTRRAIPELATGRLILGAAAPMRVRHVLSTSYGFGGTDAALLFAEATP